MMAPPPAVQWRPIFALPAMPTQPAMALCAPMCTLWPIWIRLSSLTPSSSTVSSSAPRSMQVLAPISTSSPMRTAPSCSILTQRALAGREAEAVGADDRATVQDAARTHHAGIAQRHAGRQPGAIAHHCARADVAMRADDCTGADACAGAHVGQGADRRAGVHLRPGLHHGTGVDAGGGRLAGAGGPPLGEPGKVQVGVGRDDGRATRQGQVLLGRRHHHAGSGRGRHPGRIARVGQKAQAAGVGRLQRRQPQDGQTVIAVQRPAKRGHHIGQPHRGDHGRLTCPGRSGP
jgi:hypothetical protein